PRGPDQFAFTHLTFQEYFAAFELRGRVRRFEQLAQDCSELVRHRRWHETLNLLFEMLTEFSGGCDDLLDEMVKQVEDEEVRESTAEFFSRLLLDEENGLSRQKLSTATDFALQVACKDYSYAVIKNFQEVRVAHLQTLISEWFDQRLKEAE